MKDLALLGLRLTVGGLMAGHGAQKLFGSFGGYGMEGTAGWLESMGLKPGKQWAMLAGGSEFGGGVLTALGLGGPLGPIGIASAMGAASVTAHKGKPIWVTAGGPELPVTNIAVAAALALAGPGRISLDSLLGLKVPKSISLLAMAGAVAGVVMSAQATSQAQAADEDTKEAREELQAGEDAAEGQ